MMEHAVTETPGPLRAPGRLPVPERQEADSHLAIGVELGERHSFVEDQLREDEASGGDL